MNRHAFVICAYGESKYLEECIKSVVNQTEKTPIYIASSTPSKYIDELAKQYGIEVFYREGKSDIKDDWNFACSVADAEWVTVAHQDDVYYSQFAEELHKSIKNCEDAVMAFTDYHCLIEGQEVDNINCKIRRMQRRTMKSRKLASKKWWKKRIFALGNSICCPTVTYHKAVIEGDIFTSELKFNIDWDTFVKYADYDAPFIYIDKPLLDYRIHPDATTVKCMDNSLRIKEDTIMFNKFWPEWATKIIMTFYKLAYKEYKK